MTDKDLLRNIYTHLTAIEYNGLLYGWPGIGNSNNALLYHLEELYPDFKAISEAYYDKPKNRKVVIDDSDLEFSLDDI